MNTSPTVRTGVLDALADPALRTVNIALLISVGAVLFVVVGRQIDEAFTIASDIGDVVFDVSIAYLAGWIFYYLVTWRSRAADRYKAHVQAVRGAIVLANQARSFLGSLQFSAGETAAPVLRRDLTRILQTLTFDDPTNISAGPGSPNLPLLSALQSVLRQTERSTRQVDRWASVVDTELLRLCFDVDDSTFTQMMHNYAVGFRTHPLSAFEPFLVEWLERSDKLRDWTCTRLADEVRAADPTWSDVSALAADRCLVVE